MIKKVLLLAIIATGVIWFLYYRGNVAVQQRVDGAFSAFDDFKKHEAGKSQNIAVTRARALMQQALVDERDLSNGPCLAERVIVDWSVDILTGEPEIDKDLNNQCQNFVNGVTANQVTFDSTGNFLGIE